MYKGRVTFPTEIVYLNNMWRMHYEIVGADETLRRFESREAFRQLNMKISWALYFFS